MKPLVSRCNPSLSVILFLLFCVHSIYAQPYTVAIVPFTVSPDSTLLQEGITTILSSRLQKKDTITIISQEETNNAIQSVKNFSGETLALMAGAKLQADYVIFGTVTTGDSLITLQSGIVDVSGKKPPFDILREVSHLNEIIPAINRFATDIIDTVFTTHLIADTLTDSIASPSEQVTLPGAHAAKKSTSNTTTAPSGTITEIKQKIMETETIPFRITGLAFGDVNNDSIMEIVVLTKKNILLYHYVNNTLTRIPGSYETKFLYPLSLDVADINGNGTPEIIITALDGYQNRANSLVLEFNGTGYVCIAKKLPWFFRVIETDSKKPVLIGQNDYRNNPYKGDLMHMTWDGTTYVPGRKIAPSSKINALGICYTAILQKGIKHIAGYTEKNTILIVDDQGNKIWETKEPYGGSTLYFKADKGMYTDITSGEQWIYLPIRLGAVDLDSDNSKEIIVVKNFRRGPLFFQKFKNFRNSHIEIMAWNGVGLTTTLTSANIAQTISDCIVCDIDNDGKKELLCAQIEKEGKTVFAKSQSSIVAYTLQ